MTNSPFLDEDNAGKQPVCKKKTKIKKAQLGKWKNCSLNLITRMSKRHKKTSCNSEHEKDRNLTVLCPGIILDTEDNFKLLSPLVEFQIKVVSSCEITKQ